MSTLELINTRRVIDYIQKSVREFLCNKYLTISEVVEVYKGDISRSLEELKRNRVLYDYKVDCFNEKDGILHVDITIQPMRTMEYVRLDFNVEDLKESLEALIEGMNIIVENKYVTIN